MSNEEPKRIALVGHCTPDAFALRSAIAGFIPNAQVEPLNSIDAFLSQIRDYDLLLVNRVLDGSFPDQSGIDLISAHHEGNPPMMLISNYPEALQNAVDAGGVMGFGKRAMRSEEAKAALIEALGITSNH